MNNLIPYEDTITIPIGMDCRELKFRMKDCKPGGFVLCTENEMKQLAKDNEFRVMPIDTRHERGCSRRYPDAWMRDCTCHKTDKRVCHAPGDRCLGCDHYYGKSSVCAYADHTQDNHD